MSDFEPLIYPALAPGEDSPTRPIDLRQYARAAMLEDLVDDGFEEDTAQVPLDSFYRIRRRDVPRVAFAPSELADRLVDHREGFLVSLLDGASTVETLLDVCGMPQDEALALLCSLFARGVVRFD